MQRRAAEGGGSGSRDERSRRGQDDQRDEGGAQQQQQHMPQPETPGALPLRLAQVAQRRKLGLGRNAPLEQMQQRGNPRRDEPQQRERVQERHVSRRSAIPKGRSVSTWWYAIP